MRKRSSCDSGNGFVPWCSAGFWVATTKKGSGSRWLRPSRVTRPSLIASSSAGLGLRARAVDLVGEHHLSEQRARLEHEVPGRAPVDPLGHRRPEHVARQQVARELDAPEARVDRAGEGAGQRGLADAGHVLEQQMAARRRRPRRRGARPPACRAGRAPRWPGTPPPAPPRRRGPSAPPPAPAPAPAPTPPPHLLRAAQGGASVFGRDAAPPEGVPGPRRWAAGSPRGAPRFEKRRLRGPRRAAGGGGPGPSRPPGRAPGGARSRRRGRGRSRRSAEDRPGRCR